MALPAQAIPAPADPTAVFGRRVLAVIIDFVLLAVPAALLFTSQLEYLEFGSSSEASEFCERFLDEEGGLCFNLNETAYFNDGGFGLQNAAGLGLSFLVFVVLQGLTGWTPGKLVTGIRAVQEDGRAPGIGRAFIRWILLLVDAQPCGIPLVGFITGLTTKGHRRVGDMAAKTFVVRSTAAGSPIQVPGLTQPEGHPYATTAASSWGAPAGAAPTGWPPPGQPSAPAPSGWAAPGEAPTSPPAAPSTGAPAPPAPPAPQWDEARGTYIQWDPNQSAWMQWDDTTKTWSRIPNQ